VIRPGVVPLWKMAFVAALALTVTADAALAGVAPTGAGPDDVDIGASSATVDIGDFYRAPDPLPPARAGTVIRSRPITAPEGARGWRVLYHSRSDAGDDIAVSGMVFAPAGDPPREGRPVVAWAHGTTGIADACAPTRSSNPALTIPWVRDLLDAGYVVAATDYEGLGTAGIHPYLVGASEARSVLDSIRAARRLPTGASKDAVVFGHSQGGHSALFAGEIAKDYAPGIRLRGIAAGSPVASPGDFVDHTVGSSGTLAFMVLGALGYQATYPELAAEPVLTTEGAARAAVAERGCVREVMDAFEGSSAGEVFEAGARTAALDARLRENAAGLRRSAVPVLYWQGEDDDLTPLDLAAAYAGRACRKGTRLDYRIYAGTNHVTVLEAAHDDVLEFFATVLDGARPRGNCDQLGDAVVR